MLKIHSCDDFLTEKIDETFGPHDNNKVLSRCMVIYINYCINSRIDEYSCDQMNDEVRYWIKVLERVVATVKF